MSEERQDGESAGGGASVGAAELHDRFAAVCATREATSEDAVAGVVPRLVVRPDSTETVSAVLRLAHQEGLAVVVRGSGTKLGWGNPPERCDLVVETTAMNRLLEHAAGDLIVRVEAGRTLTDLAADLAGSGQRLGIDPFRSGTIGGAVATGATGPLRLFHGAVRDLVIGVTLVRADGVIAHAGGKVVKNVAGFDLGKLLTGSYGTLAVLTEINFRLHPIPDCRRWVTAWLPVDALIDRVGPLTHGQFFPAAVEIDLPADGRSSVSVLLEGTEAGVSARAEEVRGILGDAEIADEPPLWFGAEVPGEVLVKVTHEIASAGRLAAAVLDAAEAAGLSAALRGSVLVGSEHIGLSAGSSGLSAASVAGFVERLRAAAGEFGGTVVVLDGPLELRQGVDGWGPVRGLELMRAVKAEFDPERTLAPGRFVGGI